MKNKIVFRVKGREVFVSGYPELNGKTGRLLDKDIALFRGNVMNGVVMNCFSLILQRVKLESCQMMMVMF